MLFNTGSFFFFFLLIWLIYLFQPHKKQNILLLAASYFFYGYWDYRFLILILLSTAVDYTAGIQIAKQQNSLPSPIAKRWLLASVFVNLGILGFFKYFNFFSENLSTLFASFGLHLSPLTLTIILPVGISFYTFQTMSYTIDVYRGRQKPVTDFVDFSLFVAYFPQLMAGPIERAKKLIPQIQHKRVITAAMIHEGGWLLFWGIFKKVYIADNLSPYTTWAFQNQGLTTGVDAVIAMFAFSIQLYCDFSGYSDMARGLSSLLGIKLSLNFKLPYFASNPAAVWQCWHITLGAWFRDYVYGPLTRNHRRSRVKFFATLPTMLLIGLWHGAGWHYIVWGGIWGIVLILYRLLQPLIYKLHTSLPQGKAVYTTTGICFCYGLWLTITVFFISPTVAYAVETLWLLPTKMHPSPHSLMDLQSVLWYSSPLILTQFVQFFTGNLDFPSLFPSPLRTFWYSLLFVLLLGKGSEILNEFIYFQF